MDRAAVFAVVESVPNHEDKILLVQEKTNKFPKYWKLPGGKTEIGEYQELALVRELNEEIGINIRRPLETDIIFKIRKTNHIFVVYKAIYYGGKVIAGREIEILSFFLSNDIKKMIINNEILPRHAMALGKYLQLY